MKMKISRYSVLLFALLALCCACSKEPMESPDGAVTKTILYSATVSHGPQTRATLRGSEFAADCYVFEAGDKLYVEYRAGEPEVLKLYGVLDLISGAGTGTGRFEGELKCLDFTPSDDIVLSATLVGPNAASGFFTFGDPTADPAVDPGTIVTGVNYPSSVSYTTLPQLVQKYSHFTGTSTYSAKDFANLTQQSVFLLFSLEVNRTKLSDPMEATVTIKKNDSPVLTVSDVPVTGLTAVGNIQCPAVIPLSLNPDLQSAEIWADNQKCGDNFAADLTLAANTYYNVKRSTLGTDYFRIKATVANTEVTFHANYRDYLYYSTDGGEHWTAPTSSAIVLSEVGKEICVVGRKDNYKNANPEGTDYGSPLGNPLFSTKDNKLVYICGNIMSLLCRPDAADYTHPEKWIAGTTLPVDAFNGTFSKGKNNNLTYIDINPSDPLLLPVTTLATRCYKGMFRRCTSLQYAPDLPAETPAEACYNDMFRDCGKDNLKRVACFLKVKNGEGNAQENYPFVDDGSHQNLGENGYLGKWMTGTEDSEAGTFYCHPDMNAYWSNYWTWITTSSWKQPGNQSKNQFANRPKKWTVNNWTTYILPPTP